MIQIDKLVSNLSGQSVSKVISGGGNGSIIVLDIGNPVKYCIYVHCTWRLEKGQNILSGWNESADPDNGALTLNTKALEGELIEKVILNSFYDLHIYFKSSKRLRACLEISQE